MFWRGVQAFPYAPRAGQADLVARLQGAVRDRRHAVVESGTGTGKTVCALAAVLPEAVARGKRVLYLTRTNSQERQVLVEFRRVAPLLGAPATAVALQGRRNMCPLAREEAELADASADELALVCRDRVRAAQDKAAGRRPRHEPCRHFERTCGDGLETLSRDLRERAATAEELAAAAGAHGMCGYFVARGLLKDATLVAAPYVWFFHPGLRRPLLEWMGAALPDLVVVVDEAHNLPEYAREIGSTELGRATIERAAREVEDHGDRELPGGLALSAFLTRLVGVLDGLASEFLDGDDGLVPEDAFDAELLSALRSTTRTWDRLAAALLGYGEEVREARRRAGRLPRSYVGAVGAFLVAYREADPSTHLRLVESPDDPRLVLACLDASLACAPLAEAHATVHLSGTLAPLEAYRDEVGLPSEVCDLAVVASSFPAERRRVLVDPTVTTQYSEVSTDPQAWPRMGRRLQELRRATAGRNMAVFAPSHEVLRRLRPWLPADAFVESQDAATGALLRAVEEFKAARGATLLAVAGGRVAEGLDFPGGELEVVAVAGIPYPKPTARLKGLVRFLDARHGRGFEYAVVAPALRRTLQAVGRLIRGPDDRGVAALLDRRAASFARHLPGLVTEPQMPEEAARFLAKLDAP